MPKKPQEDTKIRESEGSQLVFEVDAGGNIFCWVNIRDRVSQEEVLNFAEMICHVSKGYFFDIIKEAIKNDHHEAAQILIPVLNAQKEFNRAEMGPAIPPTMVFARKDHHHDE